MAYTCGGFKLFSNVEQKLSILANVTSLTGLTMIEDLLMFVGYMSDIDNIDRQGTKSNSAVTIGTSKTLAVQEDASCPRSSDRMHIKLVELNSQPGHLDKIQRLPVFTWIVSACHTSLVLHILKVDSCPLQVHANTV